MFFITKQFHEILLSDFLGVADKKNRTDRQVKNIIPSYYTPLAWGIIIIVQIFLLKLILPCTQEISNNDSTLINHIQLFIRH